LMAFPEWKGAKLLVALAQRMYWLLVLRSDLKAKRGDINVVKGLRIGAAPGVDLGLKRLLVEAGIDPERDRVQIGPVPGATGSGVSFGLTAAKALEEQKIDGFWANAMGAETAVSRGAGKILIDVRRGDDPAQVRRFTFAGMASTDGFIEREPESIAAAVRAIVKAQKALRADPKLAAEVGRRKFPADAAALITRIVERDAPFYDPVISEEAVIRLNCFAQSVGHLSGPVPYERVVAVGFRSLWHL